MEQRAGSYLLFDVGGRHCALAIDAVEETLRPPATEPIPDCPAFVVGAALIRGQVVPIVDGGQIVAGEKLAHATRVITLRTAGERRVGLLVSAVVGVVDGAALELDTAPPLLDGGDTAVIAALGRRDAALLHLLRLGHVVPDAIWTRLSGRGAPA